MQGLGGKQEGSFWGRGMGAHEVTLLTCLVDIVCLVAFSVQKVPGEVVKDESPSRRAMHGHCQISFSFSLSLSLSLSLSCSRLQIVSVKSLKNPGDISSAKFAILIGWDNPRIPEMPLNR